MGSGFLRAWPAGMLYSWQSTLHPFIAYATFARIAALPLAEKLVHLKNPAFRAEMLAETPRELGPQGNFVTRSFHKMFLLGDPPQYEPDPSSSIAAIAKAQGIRPEVLAYDMLMGQDGQALLYFPIFNYSNGNLDHLVTQMRSNATVLSLGDGGAHCGFICDSSLPTFMMTHWARDRQHGERLPLEFLIKKQTLDTASFYGLHDRGVLKPGYKADINVIDYQRLHLNAPYFVHDLPANGRRLMQRASGYVATIVNGLPVMQHGEPTGELPGRLIRGPQHVHAMA